MGYVVINSSICCSIYAAGSSPRTRQALDHCTGFFTAVYMSQRGRHPNAARILEQSRRRKFASCGPSSGRLSQAAPSPQARQKLSASFPVVTQPLSVRPHVVAAGQGGIFRLEPGDAQIGKEGIEYMLVGPDGIRMAHRMGWPFCAARMQSGRIRSLEKIAAADHIAGACRGNGDGKGGKKAVAVGLCDQLRAGFAVRIRVKSLETFVLAVAPHPFTVVIYLVGGHVEYREGGRSRARIPSSRFTVPITFVS